MFSNQKAAWKVDLLMNPTMLSSFHLRRIGSRGRRDTLASQEYLLSALRSGALACSFACIKYEQVSASEPCVCFHQRRPRVHNSEKEEEKRKRKKVCHLMPHHLKLSLAFLVLVLVLVMFLVSPCSAFLGCLGVLGGILVFWSQWPLRFSFVSWSFLRVFVLIRVNAQGEDTAPPCTNSFSFAELPSFVILPSFLFSHRSHCPFPNTLYLLVTTYGNFVLQEHRSGPCAEDYFFMCLCLTLKTPWGRRCLLNMFPLYLLSIVSHSAPDFCFLRLLSSFVSCFFLFCTITLTFFSLSLSGFPLLTFARLEMQLHVLAAFHGP